MSPDSVSPQGRPRAYVSAPTPPQEGVERALEWACGPRRSLVRSSVGVLVPDPVTRSRARRLCQAHLKGATIGSAEDDGELWQWPGPLVVYWPTLATMAAAESICTATRIVVVALEVQVLQPWVDAFDPQPLAGAPLTPAEAVLPVPLVRRAMVYYTHRLQHEAPVPEPVWQMLLHRLEHLYHHGQHFTAESLLALAWQLHWPPGTAWALYQWGTHHLPHGELPRFPP